MVRGNIKQYNCRDPYISLNRLMKSCTASSMFHYYVFVVSSCRLVLGYDYRPREAPRSKFSKSQKAACLVGSVRWVGEVGWGGGGGGSEQRNEIGRMCSSSIATANGNGCRFEFLDISFNAVVIDSSIFYVFIGCI